MSKTHKITKWINSYKRKSKKGFIQVRGHNRGIWKRVSKPIKTIDATKWLEDENITLQELLDERDFSDFTYDELKQFFDKSGVSCYEEEFNDGTSILIYENRGEKFVVEKETMKGEKLEFWFEFIDDDRLKPMTGAEDFDFWKGVGKKEIFYHGTKEKNLSSILKEGINPKKETRGLTNVLTPEAVFLTPNYEDAKTYGDKIVAVDVGAMKADGYTPEVEQEEGVKLANIKRDLGQTLDIEYRPEEDMESIGIMGDTIVIYKNIPPKYLKVVK